MERFRRGLFETYRKKSFFKIKMKSKLLNFDNEISYF